MIHLGLCDDCGALLSVQIFHCSIRDLDGNLWHTIGVREEERDILPRESSPTPMSIPPAQNSDLNVLIEEDSSWSSGESCDLVPVVNTEGIALWIDVSNEVLTMLRCTDGFTALVGPIAANTQFASWIKEAGVDFHHWLYGKVNSMCNSECRGAQRKLRFSPPNLGHEYYYRATCLLTLAPMDELDEETMPVKMALSDIVIKRVRVSRWLSSPTSRRAHGEPG